MRRFAPLLAVVVLAVLAFVGSRTHWFGLELATTAATPDDTSHDERAEAARLQGRLAGAGAEPTSFEGDPVGRRDLGLGGASVTGRVIDTAGAPIALARVFVALASPDEEKGVRTTKEGRFEVAGLPAGTFDLRVVATRHDGRTVATPALAADASADVGDVVLRPTAAPSDGLEVKVVDLAGRPVAGARVLATTITYGLHLTLGPERSGIPAAKFAQTTTDGSGIARFFPLAPEKYDVAVRAAGFVLEAVENVVVAAGRVERVNVVLGPGASISGFVLDLAGVPVANAYVTALQFPTFRSFGMVSTDGNGAFTLDGLAPGTQWTYWVLAGKDEKGVGSNNQVKAGAVGVKIELKGAGTLAGVVVAGGKPVQKFVVRPFQPQPFGYVYSRTYEFSDPDGRFHLDLPAGTYQVDVKGEGGRFESAKGVAVASGATVEVRVELPAAGIVRGVVTDSEGNHLEGAEVYVRTGGFPPAPVREQYVRTDAEGAFALESLGVEKVTLFVRRQGYATQLVAATAAAAPGGAPLTVRLTRGATVAGSVATSDGTPVAGERVNLSKGFELLDARSTFTGADGRYAFSAVEAGTFQVSTGRFENAASGQRKQVVVAAEGTVACDFVTQGDAEASGTVQGVVRVGGVPAANVSVTAMDERGAAGGASTTTDATGHYVARGLKPGRITVFAQAPDGVQTSESVRVREPGETVSLDIDFGRSGIRGRLVRADDGASVSGAFVTLELVLPADQADGYAGWRGNVMTKNDGSFDFSGVDAGTYRLRADSTGFAVLVSDPYPVGEGETRDVGAIRLKTGGALAGRVTDESGAPVEGVGVSVARSDGEPVFLFSLVTTGSDGRFTVNGLALGTYRVRFEKKGYAPTLAPASVSGGGMGAAVDAVLLRGGSLEAHVEDAQGRPVKGARIEVFDASGARLERTLSIANLFDGDASRTGADGTARIPDLAAGRYGVRATHDTATSGPDALSVAVAPGGTAVVRLIVRPSGP